MDKDILKNIYNDFFGIEKIKKENEKLAKELGLDQNNIPEIELSKKNESNIVGGGIEPSERSELRI